VTTVNLTLVKPDGPTLAITPPAPIALTIGTPGLQGPPGPRGIAGGASVVMYAGEALGGHRVVKQFDGGAYYADRFDPYDVVGVTLGAAAFGDPVNVAVAGEVEEPSWNWTPGPVYIGENATLTQATPTDAPLMRVGVALSPTRMVVTLDEPIY
jgi:hypothetical protein